MDNELIRSKNPSEPKGVSGGIGAEDSLVTQLKSRLKRRVGNNKDTPQEEIEIRTRLIKLLSSPEYESHLSAVIDDADVPRLAYFVRSSWKELTDETKEKLIGGLFSRTSDKAIVRQVVIARELARLDLGKPSVMILRNVLGATKKGDSQGGKISKNKREAIETYFFKKASDWIDMPVDDQALILPILRVFVEIAADPGFYKHVQNKKVLLDFGNWAIATASRLALDAPAMSEITRHLKSLVESVPSDFRADLGRKLADLTRQFGHPVSPVAQGADTRGAQPDQKAPSSKRNPAIETERIVSSTNQPETLDDKPSPTLRPAAQREPLTPGTASARTARAVTTTMHRPAMTATGEQMEMSDGDVLQHAEAWIKERETEITRQQFQLKLTRKIRDMLLAELSHRKELEKQLLQERTEKERAAEYEIELRETLNSLTIRGNQLEADNSELRNECVRNESLLRDLETQAARLKSSLEEKQNELEVEHKSFNERLDREINRKLKTHTADIERKLYRIFKNKKLSDGQEPTASHAKFLQDLFQQLEEALEDLGIKLSGEF